MAFFHCLSTTQPETSSNFFGQNYEQRKSALYSRAVSKEVKNVDSVPMISDDSDEVTKKAAEIRLEMASTPPPRVQTDDFPSLYSDVLPILFEESYVREAKQAPRAEKGQRGAYLYVFVSGYGASSGDVRRLRNFVALNWWQNGLFLISRENDGRTDGSIEEMGAKLAEEVQAFINAQCKLTLARVSFIGHSLGGLIIRAALPLLSEFSDKMHAYVSLSTPHLGLMYSRSKLMKAGMWILESVRRSASLKQLLKMKDNSELAQTALYLLSGAEGLAWFKHVLFFSSKNCAVLISTLA